MLVVLVVVAALVAVLATSDNDPERATASPLIGKLAPEITATDTQGRAVELRRYAGKWVVVNFFATWCGPCRVEHPELVRFDEARSRSGDAALISVAYNEDPAIVRAFFANNGGDWPVVAAGRENFALEYGVVKLPETFLISPDSRIVRKFDSGVTAAQLDSAIADEAARLGPSGASSSGATR